MNIDSMFFMVVLGGCCIVGAICWPDTSYSILHTAHNYCIYIMESKIQDNYELMDSETIGEYTHFDSEAVSPRSSRAVTRRQATSWQSKSSRSTTN